MAPGTFRVTEGGAGLKDSAEVRTPPAVGQGEGEKAAVEPFPIRGVFEAAQPCVAQKRATARSPVQRPAHLAADVAQSPRQGGPDPSFGGQALKMRGHCVTGLRTTRRIRSRVAAASTRRNRWFNADGLRLARREVNAPDASLLRSILEQQPFVVCIKLAPQSRAVPLDIHPGPCLTTG